MSVASEPIRVWDRARGREIPEKVYGEGAVRFLYATSLGRALGEAVLARRFFSRAYGWYQDTRLSGGKVAPFVERYAIPMEQYEPGPYRTFNEFFIRRFRPGARTFVPDPGVMPAFAEARYLAWERVDEAVTFPVKGRDLSAAALMGDAGLARGFMGGPLLLARLCPVDYHRYHYPDDGRVVDSYRASGAYHSVNPLALQARSDVLCTNERQVTLLETRNFGKLAYIEVGALCVGRIVQSHPSVQAGASGAGREFRRGDEKGYFLFGGSTVVVLGQPGRWVPAADLLRETASRRETLVRLGEAVAHPPL